MILWTNLPQHLILHIDRFSRFYQAHGRQSLYLTMGRHFPLQNCSFALRTSCGAYGPPSNMWLLRPTRVNNPNGITIGSAAFAGLTIATDRPTDRQTEHATPTVTI